MNAAQKKSGLTEQANRGLQQVAALACLSLPSSPLTLPGDCDAHGYDEGVELFQKTLDVDPPPKRTKDATVNVDQ
jgi:hypothetical protein